MQVMIVGKIIKQRKNCACSRTTEGHCDTCGTDALDIIFLDEVETVAEGMYHADIDCIEVINRLK